MHEKQQIRSYCDGTRIIRLQHVADPQSVIVRVNGEEIKPVSYDMFGSPIFSSFQRDHLNFLLRERQRETQSAYSSLTVDVEYDVKPLGFDRESIDTVEGLMNHLNSSGDFIDLLNKRALYVKEYGKIGSWILFGRYWLEPEGTVLFISSHEHADLFPSFNPVEESEHYFDVMKRDIILTKVTIPELIKCPFCGKEFSIEDIKSYNIVSNGDHLLFHKECLERYDNEQRLSALLEIMDSSYRFKYTYEQVEDDAYPIFHRKVVSIRCKTPDGTIILGDNGISTKLIFGEDFPEFDVNGVTKKHEVYVTEDGRRIGSPNQSTVSAILSNVKGSIERVAHSSNK